MKFCPECGNKLNDDVKYCSNCGFEIRKEELVNCENCGETNKPGSTVCESCGLPLSNTKSSKVSNPPDKRKKSESVDKTKIKSGVHNTERKLKPLYIYLIFGSILLISAIMFISSDMTSTPETADGKLITGGSSGVDLSNINKINDLKTYVEKNPNDKDKILELANLENDSGLFDQAVAGYKKYLVLSPGDADVLVDMGVCYYNLQNYTEAIAKMKEALQYNPKHQIAHLNLGIVNLAMGNIEKSKEWFEKTIKIDPTSEAAQRAKQILESHSQGGGN